MFTDHPRFRRAASIPLLFGLLLLALPAAAQVTSLSMTSDPGDYIGGGQTYFYGAADGEFRAVVNFAGGVSISFNTPNYEHWWNLDFAAPNGVPLTPGTYLNATRFPFQAENVPGLSVYGDGRGCNELTGSFQVLQLTYGPDDTVESFEATFEQHCEGAAPALRGQIRYNADVPLYLTAPFNVQAIQNQPVSFVVTATDMLSRSVILSASGLPSGATFTDLGNNTGEFWWIPTSTQSGTFVVTFLGDNQQGNQATASSNITVRPPPPANDDFDAARLMPGIPSSYSQDATNATTAPDDPWCYGNAQSVWFVYTPQASERLEANTFGSGYDTTLSVYTGSRGALYQIGCNDDAAGTTQSRVIFDAVAGTTYYFMVSSLYSPVPFADLVFNLQQGPPPFSFSPSISQFGTVRPSTGGVTLSGTVQCSAPAFVTLNGHLKQIRGKIPISGYWNVFVACDGVTPWTATVQTTTTLFRGRAAALFSGGKAVVGATAYAFDPDNGEYKQVDISVEVTLRGSGEK